MLKYFRDFRSWLGELADPRRRDRVVYPLPFMVMQAVVPHVAGYASNRETADVGDSEHYIGNLNDMAGGGASAMPSRMPHYTTVSYLMMKLAPGQLERLRHLMVRRLLGSRVLQGMRVRGLYMVAVDAVKYHGSRRELAHSTHVTHKDGSVEYSLRALEAKLVSPDGMVISIASERIENPEDTEYDKQDCELKAFRRLAAKLKEAYPRLRVCLLLDGLYLCRDVIGICRDNRWEYSITFKEGSAPAFHKAAMERLAKSGHNVIADDDPVDRTPRRVRWCNNVRHDLGGGGEMVNASVVRRDPCPDGTGKTLMYLTSIHLERKWVADVLDNLCRARWKIENEGFNNQKNHGLELEHVFATRGNAAYNYYLAVQIAHILLELIIRGSIFRRLQHHEHPKTVPRTICEPMLRWFGTRKRVMREIREALRHKRVDTKIGFSAWRLELYTCSFSSA